VIEGPTSPGLQNTRSSRTATARPVHHGRRARWYTFFPWGEPERGDRSGNWKRMWEEERGRAWEREIRENPCPPAVGWPLEQLLHASACPRWSPVLLTRGVYYVLVLQRRAQLLSPGGTHARQVAECPGRYARPGMHGRNGPSLHVDLGCASAMHAMLITISIKSGSLGRVDDLPTS
jgi:hypothetical protein